MSAETFGQVLRQYRHRSGLTSAEIVAAMADGTHKQSIYIWERGARNIGAEKVALLAGVLQIPADVLERYWTPPRARAKPKTKPKPRPAEALGALLRRRRIAAGLSQEDMGALLGMASNASLSDWESGRSKPQARNLARIAQILHIPSEELAPYGKLPDESAERRQRLLLRLDAAVGEWLLYDQAPTAARRTVAIEAVAREAQDVINDWRSRRIARVRQFEEAEE